MTDNIVSLLLGLVLSSEAHRDYPLWVIERNFLLSLQTGNFRLYVEDGEAIGFVNWTFLTPNEIHSLIKSGGVMGRDLWREIATSDSIPFISEVLSRRPILNTIKADLEHVFIDKPFVYGLSWKDSANPRIRKIRNRFCCA